MEKQAVMDMQYFFIGRVKMLDCLLELFQELQMGGHMHGI